MASPMEILFRNADMRCTVCQAKAGTCDCWSKCKCGWSFQKGTECGNPVHASPLDRFYWKFLRDGADKMDDATWSNWLEGLEQDEFDAAVAAHGVSD